MESDEDSEDSEAYERRIAEELEAKRAADEEAARIAALPTDAELLAEALEREKKLEADKEAMKAENDQLQLIVNDLARRLQNAQYTIDAQRKISNESVSKSNAYRIEMESMARRYQLEIAKSTTIMRKRTKDEQAKKYEAEKLKVERSIHIRQVR